MHVPIPSHLILQTLPYGQRRLGSRDCRMRWDGMGTTMIRPALQAGPCLAALVTGVRSTTLRYIPLRYTCRQREGRDGQMLPSSFPSCLPVTTTGRLRAPKSGRHEGKDEGSIWPSCLCLLFVCMLRLSLRCLPSSREGTAGWFSLASMPAHHVPSCGRTPVRASMMGRHGSEREPTSRRHALRRSRNVVMIRPKGVRNAETMLGRA